MDAQELTLMTIFKGSVPERFAIELAKVMENIADPNTSVKKTRKIVMEFTITAFPDRSGGSVLLTRCKSELPGIDTSDVSCTFYLAKDHEGRLLPFTRDVRQSELVFADEGAAVDGKTAGAGQ